MNSSSRCPFHFEWFELRHHIALLVVLLASSALSACASISQVPLNKPLVLHLSAPAAAVGGGSGSKPEKQDGPGTDQASVTAGDDKKLLIVTLFSGGGLRSAAFGLGAVDALAKIKPPVLGGQTLADQIVTVTGVSGGSFLAAYLAMKGVRNRAGFKRDVLDQNIEEQIGLGISPLALANAYEGGAATPAALAEWLDANVFRRATFGQVSSNSGPRLLIHGTDLASHTPFVFDAAHFGALCSEIKSYPISSAVAASSAVPILFAPAVIRNYAGNCADTNASRANPIRNTRTLTTDRHELRALNQYREADAPKSIKVLDGGLVDALGTRVLATSMLQAPSPESPVDPARLMTARSILFLVLDASTKAGSEALGAATIPKPMQTVLASVDTMIDTASRQGFDIFKSNVEDWRAKTVKWRCAVKKTSNCTQLETAVVRLAIEDIEDLKLRTSVMNIPTRLNLSSEDVQVAMRAGRMMVDTSEELNSSLRRLY